MEQFYFDRRDTIKRVLVDKKLIFIGNFNARIGSYTEKWKGAPGCNEVGKCNSNEELPLALCSENGLVVTNTIIKNKNT